MDFIRTLYKRETGRRTTNTYDLALRRLKCYDCNEFCGIYPNIYGQNYNPDSPVFACQFCCKENYQHWLALANEDGMIAIQDTSMESKRSESGEIYAEGTQAHHNAIFDLAWMEEELKLVSVSGDHTAVLWDVSIMPCRQLRQFKGHTRSVKTVVFRPQDKAVFATGARDGMIMVWDTRSNQGPSWDKPDNFITNSHHALGPSTPSSAGSGSRSRRNKSTPTSRANSITGLVFQDQDHLISCGAGDGLIKVWDLRKNYSAYKREPLPCHMLPYPGSTSRNGFTNMVLDPGKLKLYASCMDSTIYCYNVATYESKPVAVFTGHQNSTFYVKSCLSPDGLYLASGSSDERAYIWNTQGSDRPVTSLVGHRAEVTCVQWCPVGGTKIVTCSDDARHRIWQVGFEFEGDNEAQLKGWTQTPKVTHTEEENTNQVAETTPRANKIRISRQERTPDFVCSNVTLPDTTCRNCNANGWPTTPCAVCLSVQRRRSPKTKRRLQDLLDDGASCSAGSCSKRMVLSPVREGNQESRAGLETRGARRLFSPRKHNVNDQVSTGDQQLDTETRSDINSVIMSSPTLNLPNYVLDGTSPHHQCSPNTRLKENVDWLTKLRKERTSNGERPTSPSAHITPRRRLTRSRSHEVTKGTSPKGNSETLLRFFRVSGKPNGEAQNCSATQGGSSPKLSTVDT